MRWVTDSASKKLHFTPIIVKPLLQTCAVSQIVLIERLLKVATLNALAPTGSEPPFLIAQVIVMLIFVVWTVLAVKKFRPDNFSARP